MPSVAQQRYALHALRATPRTRAREPILLARRHLLAHTSAGTHCAGTRARTLQTHILLAHWYALCRHTLCCVQPGQSGSRTL